MKFFSASAILFTTACVHALDEPTISLRGSVSVEVNKHTKQTYIAKKARNTECISDGGLGPFSRGDLTADQVCARDFSWDSTKRVAYQCQRGARWACCNEAEAGETTEQNKQNLGTCTRFKGDGPADDEDLVDVSKKARNTECISDGGLGPFSRGDLTADQVCARDFSWDSTKRVAYQCQRGARWACCNEAEAGETTEQNKQNLGTCTRFKGDGPADDEDLVDVSKKAKNTECISDGGLAPVSRGDMTADQVCALHFSWDSTKRVAYQCQRGARWACCNEAEAGETTEQNKQNLGTCTRVMDEEAADDEDLVDVSKKAKNTECISDGGLAPVSRGDLTADQVCALHFSWDSTKRVAYQCQRGARWACCNEAEAGETTEQNKQNLGTCTRVTDEEAADDEDLVDVSKKARNTVCISDGGLGPVSRGGLTADQICARDFAWDSTKRVAYQCQRGARWACCNEAEAGETTEQNKQNLGTCTRVTDEEAADDEEGTVDGDTEDAKDAGSDDSEPPEVLKIE